MEESCRVVFVFFFVFSFFNFFVFLFFLYFYFLCVLIVLVFLFFYFFYFFVFCFLNMLVIQPGSKVYILASRQVMQSDEVCVTKNSRSV